MTESSEPGGYSARQTDPFAHYDAAYVLGALSPTDRAAFEQHMDACGPCSASVRELAGMPGLLAHAESPGEAAQQDPRHEPPPLAGLAGRATRRRRQRTAVTLASVAIAVLACLALVFVALGAGGTDDAARPMAELGQYPVEGSVLIKETAEGSRIEMSCSYGGERAWKYALVLIPRTGSAQKVATWLALPGETVHISLPTGIDRTDLAAIEVRTARGTPVLRLDTTG